MSTKNLTEFKSRIKAIREASGLTREEFAKKVNVSGAYVGQLESGKKENPSPLFLGSVKKTFNINPVWLETGDGSMNVVSESQTNYSVLSDLEEMLLRIIKEGDETKKTAVRALLSALDPGKNKVE